MQPEPAPAPATLELGAASTRDGVTVALALHGAGAGRLGIPARHHYFIRHAEAWALIDIRIIARRSAELLPPQLWHDYYADAHMDRLRTAASWLARVGVPSPEPPAATPSQAQPRPWWIDLET